jgi:protein-disulfide isomerase
MAEKALDEAAIDRILKDKGVDLDRAHSDMKSPEIEKQIAENKALAREIGVDGTPGFVVGDKMIGGFLEDDILNAVKAEAAGASARSGTAK